MQKRKLLASLLGVTSVGLIVYFFLVTQIKVELDMYFKPEYYLQFSLLILSVALLDASFLLFRKAKRTNLSLAIYGYMVVEEILFDLIGVTSASMPLAIYVIMFACAVPCIWIAHTNTFDTTTLSTRGLIISLMIGALESLLPIIF